MVIFSADIAVTDKVYDSEAGLITRFFISVDQYFLSRAALSWQNLFDFD